jgi:hypothetical protein
VAAKNLGPTWLPSLSLSFTDGVGTAMLSRNALGVDIPATANYRTVFERLFPPADAEQLEQAKARLALNRSVLETAVGEVKDLRRKLGSIDQQRLDQYLDSARDVEQRLVDREQIIERGRPEFDEQGVQLERQAKNRMQEHIELMIDLIALAFQTDMTRVVTHSLGGEAAPTTTSARSGPKRKTPLSAAPTTCITRGRETAAPSATALTATKTSALEAIRTTGREATRTTEPWA